MKTCKNPSAGRKQRGGILLEGLVSVLIFSVGLLGLVGLQASMVRAQGTAKFRAEAAHLTSDLLGTMWSDRQNLPSYATTASCATHPRCADWLHKVGNTLPQGEADVSVTPSGNVALTVTWTTSNEGAHRYAVNTSITY